jgi:tetratricopeptide (TPR) repeat protein
MEELAADPKAAELPPASAVLLASGLRDAAAAVALLLVAAGRHPDDVWVNHTLATRLGQLRPAPRQEQVRYYTAARAVRPETAHDLAHLLETMGRTDEALAVFADLVARRPADARHLACYGRCLSDHGRSDAAPVLERAVAAGRAEIRRMPGAAWTHLNLGTALLSQGKLEEAIAELRTAIRLQPDYAPAHYNLGNVLQEQGKVEEAIAEYRTTIRLQPDQARPHCALGLVLQQQGDYAEALAELRKGHALGSKQPDWPYPTAQLVQAAERMAALAERLPKVLKGDDSPRDDDERLALAQMCYITKRFAAAARFWADALESDPTIGDDRRMPHRYNAACAAAMASAGQGIEGPKPDEAARAKLRDQALGWLKAELAAWKKALDGGDAQARAMVAPTLQHWKVDPDPTAIREAADLEKLTDAERKQWQELWAEVDVLLARAGSR